LLIRGPLDIPVLEACIKEAVLRHDALRTRIVTVDRDDYQVVDERCDFHLPVVSLAGGDDRDWAYDFGRSAISEPVDLSVGPLFDARLGERSQTEHVLILMADHVIADCSSIQVLCTEIWSSYVRRSQGQPCTIERPAIQFADYAIWLKQVRPLWLAEHGAYWRENLEGASFTFPRVDVGAQVGTASITSPLGEDLIAALSALALRQGTSPGLVVLAIYAAVMARWCDTDDVLISFVVDDRWRPELRGMIGELAYHLHLRIRVRAGEDFESLLKSVVKTFYLACLHQDHGWVPSIAPQCAETFRSVRTTLYFNWLPPHWLSKLPPAVASPHQIEPLPYLLRDSDALGTPFLTTAEQNRPLLRYSTGLLEAGSVMKLNADLVHLARQVATVYI
jgi:hypothetical protein